MLSSFTKDEKKLLILALGLFFGGSLAVPFYKQKQNTAVFLSGQKQQTTSTVQSVAPPAIAPPAITSVTSDGKIDLNTADEKELEALPGVGPSRAKDIIAYRTQNGAFRSVEDLDNVKGFGPEMMGKIRDHVFVGGVQIASAPAPFQPVPPAISQQPQAIAPGALAAAPAPAMQLTPVPQMIAPPPVSSTPPLAETAPININTATLQELETLKGVGPALGKRIIDYRNQYGRFQRPEDIDKVKGVGQAILQANRHRLFVK